MNRIALLLFVIVLGFAGRADAQWYFAGYLGANATKSADVTVTVPSASLALTFRNVEFDAHPFESPQYYGWRLGKLVGAHRRLGVELEFIHLKVIGLTNRAYATTGTSGTATLAPGDPMSRIVGRYSMTHGLNFAVVNLVVRQPLASGRAALILRGGAGLTIPHTETTVLGVSVDKYESGGPGIHGAAGLDVRLSGRLSFLAEYKFTRAQPEISVSGGRGRTTSTTHHVAAGLAFGLSR